MNILFRLIDDAFFRQNILACIFLYKNEKIELDLEIFPNNI